MVDWYVCVLPYNKYILIDCNLTGFISVNSTPGKLGSETEQLSLIAAFPWVCTALHILARSFTFPEMIQKRCQQKVQEREWLSGASKPRTTTKRKQRMQVIHIHHGLIVFYLFVENKRAGYVKGKSLKQLRRCQSEIWSRLESFIAAQSFGGAELWCLLPCTFNDLHR